MTCTLGTPPRLDGKTINYSKLVAQFGDEEPVPFSFLNRTVKVKVVHSYAYSVEFEEFDY